MKHRRDTADRSEGTEDDPKPESGSVSKRRKHPFRRIIGLLLLLLVLVAVVGRAMLPRLVRDYVNSTLDRNPLYSGRIGEVEIHLWRGAYSIRDVRISKTAGNVPVPLFSATRVDFAIQWDALLHRKFVGRVVMEEPQINFVDASDESDDQTGAGGPWLQMIQDLFPFRINRALIRNGSVHFRAFETETPVDIYLSRVEGSIDNLGNIRDETKPLVSTAEVAGLAMDHAKFEFNMTLDPFSYRPTFHMAMRLLNLDVTKINDLALAYGNFDFEHGWFDFVVEADAKEGRLTGYAKPLFRHLEVLSLRDDVEDGNVLQVFWQALVGAVAAIFKNQPRDQFGTMIPFSGDISGSTTTDILATIGNVLRNAFIRAYLPRLEGGGDSTDGLTFEPPELTDPLSVGDSSGEG
jgi:hypothetical protein